MFFSLDTVEEGGALFDSFYNVAKVPNAARTVPMRRIRNPRATCSKLSLSCNIQIV